MDGEGMTDLPTFTEPQTRQLHILRLRGYTLTILHRDEDKLQLGVAGQDPSGARLIGKIDSRGKFVGELVDYQPSMVAVGAPPVELTIEELMA